LDLTKACPSLFIASQLLRTCLPCSSTLTYKNPEQAKAKHGRLAKGGAGWPLLPPFFGIFSFYHAWVLVKVNMKWKRIKEK
jgi:hypothetical protein